MVPFAALPESGCAGAPAPPILASHQVVVTPSLSIYLTHQSGQTGEPRTTFSREVAIVADPVFDAQDDRVRVHSQVSPVTLAPDHSPAPLPNRSSKMMMPHSTIAGLDRRNEPTLPRLIDSGAEANEILEAVGPVIGREKTTVWLGFNASVETVLSPAMQDYRILHLATHGVLDESSPGFSGLVFSLVSPDGSPVFGYLKARDIANLNLRSDMVVLSACDSGAGNNLSGEGVTGLPYAFLHAGVRQVVSTLWKVDDETSRELMVGFYKEIFLNGNEPAEALRRGQLIIMQSAHRSAPYYWAGFEITSVGN
jgi:CHAT domain-containing protein